MFFRIRKRSSLCGFDWEESPEKAWRNGKKYYELKAEFASLSVCVCVCMCVCVCVCVCECVFVWKINSFDVIAIIYKVYKKGKSPIKKKVKVQDF